MGEVSKFLGRPTGHLLRNAIAAAEIQITSATNVTSDGVVVANNFGGIGVTGVSSNVVSITFLNASSAATPVFALTPFGDTGLLATDPTDQVFLRLAGTTTNSAAVGIFAGAGTSLGTFHIQVFGAVRGNAATA